MSLKQFFKFRQVSYSDEFMDMDAERLTEILQRNSLSIHTEDAIFDAVIRWVQYDTEKRKSNLQVLSSIYKLIVHIMTHVELSLSSPLSSSRFALQTSKQISKVIVTPSGWKDGGQCCTFIILHSWLFNKHININWIFPFLQTAVNSLL